MVNTNLEVGDCELYQTTTPEFACTAWGKPWRAEITVAGNWTAIRTGYLSLCFAESPKFLRMWQGRVMGRHGMRNIKVSLLFYIPMTIFCRIARWSLWSVRLCARCRAQLGAKVRRKFEHKQSPPCTGRIHYRHCMISLIVTWLLNTCVTVSFHCIWLVGGLKPHTISLQAV
jgi:hypothetical protein